MRLNDVNIVIIFVFIFRSIIALPRIYIRIERNMRYARA